MIIKRTVLAFGFVTKTVDKVLVFWLWLSNTCTVSWLSLSPCTAFRQQAGWGFTKKLGGDNLDS